MRYWYVCFKSSNGKQEGVFAFQSESDGDFSFIEADELIKKKGVEGAVFLNWRELTKEQYDEHGKLTKGE